MFTADAFGSRLFWDERFLFPAILEPVFRAPGYMFYGFESFPGFFRAIRFPVYGGFRNNGSFYRVPYFEPHFNSVIMCKIVCRDCCRGYAVARSFVYWP